MGKVFSYIRCSHVSQNEQRQIDALKGIEVDEIVIEKMVELLYSLHMHLILLETFSRGKLKHYMEYLNL